MKLLNLIAYLELHMGAEFSECHCRASGERAAEQLLVTAYQDRRTRSADVLDGKTLAFDGRDKQISSDGCRIGVDEPGTFTRLFLVTPTDPAGWSVVYPYPRVRLECDFDSFVGGLGCDALFGFSSQRTFAWAWAEYRHGKPVDSCSYTEPGVWSRNGKAGAGDEPPPELRPAGVFAAHGREFTHRAFWWVLSDYCDLAAEHRPPFRLVEVKVRCDE